MDLDKKQLAKQIFGAHQICGLMTGLPELALTEPESEALAEAIIGIAPYYDLSLAPKTLAHIQLVTTVIMIYGPKVYAVYVRAKMEQKSGVVTSFTRNPPTRFSGEN